MGQPDGYKLYAIRSGSVYEAIGLHNGDRLAALSGMKLTDARSALDLDTKLRAANALELEVDRRGGAQLVKITITK
jgi:general secretion pathway protein C